MNDAIGSMLERYECRSADDYVNALREILQEVALLGLWRGKFFERAAFYGGTALRVLHGLDRYSEDLDFSLLAPDPSFSLGAYGDALRREIGGFGFQAELEPRAGEGRRGAIESAFLKAVACRQLITIEAPEEMVRGLHPAAKLKIKLEVDTDPPPGFKTESRYLLRPIPFSVRIYSLPDLLAGKIHAALCRRWKSRVKGRDWYDLAWYAARHPRVRLGHLEARMRQSGDYREDCPLTGSRLRELLRQAVDVLDVEQAREEAAPFVKDRAALEVWSRAFFREVAGKITGI